MNNDIVNESLKSGLSLLSSHNVASSVSAITMTKIESQATYFITQLPHGHAHVQTATSFFGAFGILRLSGNR